MADQMYRYVFGDKMFDVFVMTWSGGFSGNIFCI